MADLGMQVISRVEAMAAKKTRYFTGLPCLHGHIAERLTSNRSCYECAIAQQAVRSKTEEWKDYRLNWERQQRATNGEEVRRKARQQYQKHKPRILGEVKKYQEAHREQVCERKANKYHSLPTEDKRRIHLKTNYGITPEDYGRMYESQNGLCAICGGSQHRLFVDHCHATGKVRGLLCQRCNHGLGHFRDNPEFLKAAIKYLG